ncbi:hypothetical protein V5O48_014111 [Marasmius crinis-equi]|uniref:Fungal-type protein kinase domain-containing protein n=1 Tax=Marasmius crinis-equi TaxID=585013 RepID=A0ABR3EYK8_9AGAR
MQNVPNGSADPTPPYTSSPRKSDATHLKDYTNGNIDKRRDIIMETFEKTLPKHNLDYFLKSALPDVPAGVVQKTYEALKANGTIVKKGRGKNPEWRWSWYKAKDPRDMGMHEDVVYSHLAEISKAVIDAAQTTSWPEKQGQAPTVEFRCRPNHASDSDTQNSTAKTDADQELINYNDPKRNDPNRAKVLLDSVSSAEFKKKNIREERNENARQLCTNASHAMGSDPRRRFRFGITIEDTQMRFWFFSRGFNFVTEDFNFITNPEPFIHYLLATSFATLEELGYDPTVKRVLYKGEWHYDFKVVGEDGKDHWYRTVRSIATHRAQRLPGRGVRVYEVIELDENSQPIERDTCVLKDYWLTTDSKSESEIQDDIITRAHKVRGGDPEDIKKHFMTILHDWVVKIGRADRSYDDDTLLHLHRKNPPEDPEMHTLKETVDETLPSPPKLPGVNRQPTGSLNMPAPPPRHDLPDEPDEPYVFEPRVHRRLIFKEVGVTLEKLTNQRHLAQSLAEATEGLKIFYDAEYVHRDISGGNLLRCKASDNPEEHICKISDLEYARVRLLEEGPNCKSHKFKTGTPAYMAIEVQNSGYLFQKVDLNKMLEEESGDMMWEDEADVQFLHNFLHDLEGLWWIMIYNLFNTRPEAKLPSNLKARRIARDRIFPNSVHGSKDREHFFMQGKEYLTQSGYLPEEYRRMSREMGRALVTLTASYRKASVGGLKDQNFRGAHDALKPFFSNATEHGIERFYSLEVPDPTSVVTNGELTRPGTRKRTSQAFAAERADSGASEPPAKQRRSNQPEDSSSRPSQKKASPKPRPRKKSNNTKTTGAEVTSGNSAVTRRSSRLAEKDSTPAT